VDGDFKVVALSQSTERLLLIGVLPSFVHGFQARPETLPHGECVGSKGKG
jgi:hypothetical protein